MTYIFVNGIMFLSLKENSVHSSGFLNDFCLWGMAVFLIDGLSPSHFCILVMTFGFSEDARIRATNVRADNGQMHFTVERINGVTTTFDVTLNL